MEEFDEDENALPEYKDTNLYSKWNNEELNKFIANFTPNDKLPVFEKKDNSRIPDAYKEGGK